MPDYDPDQVRRFYDEFGEREWDRLGADPRGRVIFHIHCELLFAHLAAGAQVLEVGAGPGRFTIELARLGALVTVGDISPVQLELNRVKVEAAGLDAQVRERLLLDIVDLSRFGSGGFDAVVCYGSPLCYVWDQERVALAEMLRVLKPAGLLFLSVSSTTNAYLPWLLERVRRYGIDAIRESCRSGIWADDPHRMRTYTWSELKSLLDELECEVIAASASNLQARIENLDELRELERDPLVWQTFLENEMELCHEPGVLGAGSHIIVVVRKA